ncbi:phage tail tape measure protein [Maritimibacter sp. HL-12]|uniref:phage tail tape measure protein n=1 Tax=Maritimibacter sp. HL-12 TaxID=1162418 RepID=UPI000A0F3687|nr:phage tail tape measure protein [Maritimibacter sp. HL-12]SMH55162.1 phage tail tape measure protein, lambda family [Maritimibacter sp. HL-12]
MADLDRIDGFDDQLAALEGSLQSASVLTASFRGELDRMGASVDRLSTDVGVLSGGFSRGLKNALDGLVFGSMTLSDAFRSLRQTMIDTVYDASVRPVTNHAGGLLAEAVGGMMNALLPYAKGGAFSQGRVMPFARGGVVSGPVAFPMRGGSGLMGEAGPEAIMPLARGANGKLGVQLEGGGRPVNVTMHISTPDVMGFRRSQGQIAAQVSRAIARGNRFS